MQEKTLSESSFSFKQIKNKFDTITSENGKNWLLALNWILVIEYLSSIIEYQFLESSKSYIEYIPNGVYKELIIATLIVITVWYSVYNFIFVKKQNFFTFMLFVTMCLYLFLTKDLTFNLLLHNINIYQTITDGFSIYMIIQLLLKFIILYLIFKMLLALKNRNK